MEAKDARTAAELEAACHAFLSERTHWRFPSRFPKTAAAAATATATATATLHPTPGNARV